MHSYSVCQLCANSAERGNIQPNTGIIDESRNLINTYLSAHRQTQKNIHF